MFSTERLILRSFRESDMDDLLRLHNNALVQRTLTLDYIVPRGPKHREKIQELTQNPLFFDIITLKDTGEFMGLSSIVVGVAKNRDGNFGIALHPDYWNKGYGNEVTKFVVDYSFRSLAMNRLSLDVFASNLPAISLYKKIGFIEEGRKRQANWADGGWEDSISMGMLAIEWAEQNKKT